MPANIRRVTPSQVLPGTVVSVSFLGVFRHKGIVSDRCYAGKPTVISNSPTAGGVTEEPWDIFAAGNEVTVEGYPSELPSCTVVQRTRAQIGSPYQLFNWNCEHLVSYAHGQSPASPQVHTIVALSMLFGIIGILRANCER